MMGREEFQPEGFGFKLKVARFVVLVGVITITGYNREVLRSGSAQTWKSYRARRE